MPDDLALLNANAAFGLNVAQTPDYTKLPDLLREMDRLGVAQAVAWNQSAIPHAPSGNRRLLDAWQALPAAARARVVPSLVVAPPMRYERGAMEELAAMLRGHGLRALRALPRTLGYDIRHLEPVLETVRAVRPVVFVSIKELEDAWSLLHLAERYPETAFVVTDTMWGGMNALVDLMRRRENILAETSNLHIQGALALLVREFGAARVVFGMGPRAHAGAAIAGLRHGGLAPEAELAVARGTLAGRLGLGPPPAAAPGGKPRESFWQRFLNGAPLGAPLLDMHAHLGASSRWMLEEGDPAATVRQLLERMDRIGIRQTLVFLGSNPQADDVLEGNAFLERITRPHHDRLKGMLYFHPAYAADLARDLDAWFAGDFFVGFKLLCSYWKTPIGDAVFAPVWAYANRHRLPILIHTWGGSYDAPRHLAEIVRRHPEATFVLGHSGGNDAGRAEAEALAQANPNVVLEWCGSFCSRRRWEDTLAALGNARVVFGTDSVYHSVDWELGRLLSLDVPDDVLAPILGANAQAILARRR